MRENTASLYSGERGGSGGAVRMGAECVRMVKWRKVERAVAQAEDQARHQGGIMLMVWLQWHRIWTVKGDGRLSRLVWEGQAKYKVMSLFGLKVKNFTPSWEPLKAATAVGSPFVSSPLADFVSGRPDLESDFDDGMRSCHSQQKGDKWRHASPRR